MKSIDRTKSFDNWIRTEVQDLIQQLLINRELLEGDQENKYFHYAANFVKKLKKEILGDKLVFKIVKVSSNQDKIFVNAIVMEPDETNYVECEHPIKDGDKWEISSFTLRNKIDEVPKENFLYEANYTVKKSRRYLDEIININLDTCKEINETFSEQLTRIGGPLLVEAAEKVFSSDIEKKLAEKLLMLNEPLKKQISDQEVGIKEKKEKLDEEQKRYDNRFNELTDQQRQWKKILDKIDQYIEIETDKEEQEERPIHPWDPEKLVDMLQSLIYHNSEDDLIYDERVTETFLRAIQTNTMVVLSGPSGTGKSSIVTEFAHAIKGAKATLVPVQSGWTDTQDLLGYFNPLDQCFVPTPFMEALADAANDSNHLHLICLDEMNLAHVEYYFSEFLSSREKKSPSIRLYSERYFSIAKKRLEQDQSDPESEKFMNAADLVYRYPHNFTIPSNIRFIGTMNMDHTVKSLSPKVIDRSFIIEIDHLDKAKKDKIKKKVIEKEFTGCIDVSVQELSEVFTDENAFEKEVQEIIDLSLQLDNIANAPLNSRGRKQITCYLDRIPKEKLAKTVKTEYYDQLIYSKILPRIEMSKKNEEGMRVLQEFQEKIKGYKHSSEKFQKMLADERFVRFW